MTEPSGLARRLGTRDAALLTIGSVVGTGIFLTGGDVARAVRDPWLILLVWFAGGVLALAGALTYGELGGMFPRAGGLYEYLRQAYGPVWGFFYGWTSLLVIMSGGIAAIAVGFGEYAGTFVPWFSSNHVLASVPLGDWTWSANGAQAAAVLAILLLTTVNHFGVREGAATQNALTVLKVGALFGFVALGVFASPAPAAVPAPAFPESVPSGSLLAGVGLAMIAVLWTYDGWYGATFAAGEMKDPRRSLPRGLVIGAVLLIVLYVSVNAVYLHALSPEAMAAGTRTAEDAARVLFGHAGARAMSLVVLVASFGCLAATILWSARIYQPMAADGLFFRRVAEVHPRYRTPVVSLWLQSAWAMVLALTGSYTALFTWVTFAGLLFHVACGMAVFVLRRRAPHAERPYRVWGYPIVPLVFVAGMALLVANTLVEAPVQSVLGLLLIVLGWPAYAVWRRSAP